jgi:predicted transcriptional regulator
MNRKSDLHEFIGKHYGTQARMARDLGITPATIRGWITKNPRGILKHTPEIVKEKNVTASQLVWEVMAHESAMQS